MTDHNSAVEKRTAVDQTLFSTKAVAATFSKSVTDGGTATVADDADVDACPNGDVRCNGPNGEDLPCFACFEVER